MHQCQALWYRTDLMDSPPETWEELREMATTLTKDDMFGMAFQGGPTGTGSPRTSCPSSGATAASSGTRRPTPPRDSEQPGGRRRAADDSAMVADDNSSTRPAPTGRSTSVSAPADGKAAMCLTGRPSSAVSPTIQTVAGRGEHRLCEIAGGAARPAAILAAREPRSTLLREQGSRLAVPAVVSPRANRRWSRSAVRICLGSQ